MGHAVRGGHAWRRLRFAAIQLASAGVGMLVWMLLPRFASGAEQGPAILAFAVGPVVALPLTLGVPAMLPNSFRRRADGAFLRPGSWAGPLRLVGVLLGVVMSRGVALGIVASSGAAPLDDIALTASYAAGMGTWLISAQVARIRDSLGLMAAGALLNPLLPLSWAACAAVGLPASSATGVTVILIGASCAGIWASMGGLLRSGGSAPARDARAALVTALVLVPHLMLFAVLVQGIRLSAMLVGQPALVEAAHLASLGLTMVSVLINAIHALLSVRIQTADDPGLPEAVGATSAGYGALAVGSTIVTQLFYLVLPAISGVGIPFAVAAPLGLAVPALALYYACSAIQLRTGTVSRLLTASATATALWAILTVVLRPESLLELAAVYAAVPVALAAVAAVLGLSSPNAVTRAGTRLMLRRIGLPIVASRAIIAASGLVGWLLDS